MSRDIWAPLLTSNPNLCNKDLRARNKVAHVEILRELVPRYAVGTDSAEHKKIFCLPKKRANLKTKYITTTLGMSCFLTQYRMRYAIYVPPNTKELAINLT